MSESPKSIPQRISQTLERQAGEKFGPKRLTKEILARTLNLDGDQITHEEWADISEFAVNAGASLIRTAIEKDVPDAVATGDVEAIVDRIEKNKDNFLPQHDIFHAAETYKLTGGKRVSAEFLDTDVRGRYTNPDSAVAELYPILFLVLPYLQAPLPVLLSSKEGRSQIAEVLPRLLDTDIPGVQEFIDKLDSSDFPQTPAERQQEYEELVQLILICNAISRLQVMDPPTPLTTPELIEIRMAFSAARENPAAHYKQFAEKVFSQTDWSAVPRLFLDELLDSIRQIPQ